MKPMNFEGQTADDFTKAYPKGLDTTYYLHPSFESKNPVVNAPAADESRMMNILFGCVIGFITALIAVFVYNQSCGGSKRGYDRISDSEVSAANRL